MDPDVRTRKIVRVLRDILFLNWGVAAAKIAYGLLTHSMSITADGFHSLADGSSNIVGILGMRLASMPKDEDHPYGHKKYETIAAAVIGLMLVTVGVGLLRTALDRFQSPSVPKVDATSFAVMLMTIAVNVFIIRYEYAQGMKLRSEILISDSHHTRSDVYVSASVLLSLVAVTLGYPVIDVLGSVLISLVILKAAYEVLSGCLGTLIDRSRVNSEHVRAIALAIEGINSCHKIRSRGQEESIMIDLHIQVSKDMTVEESHSIVHRLQEKLMSELPNVHDVVVHTEPDEVNEQATGSALNAQ